LVVTRRNAGRRSLLRLCAKFAALALAPNLSPTQADLTRQPDAKTPSAFQNRSLNFNINFSRARGAKLEGHGREGRGREGRGRRVESPAAAMQ